MSMLLKAKILVVEDDPICQKAVKHMLHHAGYQVDIADSGKLALSMYQKGYDAILLDIELPDMDGLTICRIIRSSEMEGQTKIPIIALTTCGEPTKSLCFRMGMNDFISKPASVEVLQTVFNKFLQ